LAWDLGYRSITTEYDSQSALDLIADTKENDFHPHENLLTLKLIVNNLNHIHL